MYVGFSTGLRQMLMKDTAFKEAFTNGVIYVYSGPPPADADSAVTGTLLGKVTKDGGAFSFGSATNGINFDNPVAGVANKAAAENWVMTGIASGVAGWARLMGNVADALGSSTTLPRVDIDIAQSGAAWLMVNLQIEVGALTNVSVFQVTFPATSTQ